MMHCKKLLLLIFGAVAALPLWAEGYELVQLERMALAANRSLLAARDRLDGARSAVDTAAAWPNPELEYSSGTQRARGPGGNPGDARSYGITQPLDMPWLRSARIAAAQAGLTATQAETRAFEADLLQRLRLRYFELLRREADLRNAKEDAQLLEGMRSRIALRVELGEAPRYELIKADAEMLNAQKSAQAAGFRVAQARSLLRLMVGQDLPENFGVTGRLRDIPDLPPRATLLAELQGNSPELARGRAELVRAEQLLALERKQRWPKLAIKASIDEDPDVKTSKVGVVLTVPLWDRRQGPIGEASALRSKASNELAGQEFSLAQQLEVACQQYEIALAQVTALEGGILRQAENALKVAEAAYRFGERGYIEVLDAQRVRRAARVELIAARYELAAAWVEIERLRALPVESKP